MSTTTRTTPAADPPPALPAPGGDDDLPNPERMSLADLKSWDAGYTARLVNGGGPPFTTDEDQHWGRITEQISLHTMARRHTIAHRP